MLLVSYLLACDEGGECLQLGLADVLAPGLQVLEGQCVSRPAAGAGAAVSDLFVSAHYADGHSQRLCLPELPPALLAALAQHGAVPVLDFSSGISASLRLQALPVRDCA